VWGERGGGMHGSMSTAASQISDAHYPVSDGWAPLRRPADGLVCVCVCVVCVCGGEGL
jgi:hypothetical protein